MDEDKPRLSRRDFVAATTLMGAVAGSSTAWAKGEGEPSMKSDFKHHQAKRRKELWGLLGDLPKPRTPKATVLRKERGEGYTLEHLELDINGIEKVPAILLLPDSIQEPAPALNYIHWHGGNYDGGKQELFEGNGGLKPYAPEVIKRGIVTLAIDSWCFGERKTYKDKRSGRQGEEDTFKHMLWNGQVLWGMMMFDEWQAINYLCSRPEVDESRIGSFGMSMGSTKSWWLAALDERISCCMDLCCLTDFQSLIDTEGLRRHGIYYNVPSLLKHFQTHDINELIVPRPRLSLNGRFDGLTPPQGVERVHDYLEPLYNKHGNAADLQIELFDCKHVELPEMRNIVLEWMDKYLVKKA